MLGLCYLNRYPSTLHVFDMLPVNISLPITVEICKLTHAWALVWTMSINSQLSHLPLLVTCSRKLTSSILSSHEPTSAEPATVYRQEERKKTTKFLSSLVSRDLVEIVAECYRRQIPVLPVSLTYSHVGVWPLDATQSHTISSQKGPCVEV